MPATELDRRLAPAVGDRGLSRPPPILPARAAGRRERHPGAADPVYRRRDRRERSRCVDRLGAVAERPARHRRCRRPRQLPARVLRGGSAGPRARASAPRGSQSLATVADAHGGRLVHRSPEPLFIPAARRHRVRYARDRARAEAGSSIRSCRARARAGGASRGPRRGVRSTGTAPARSSRHRAARPRSSIARATRHRSCGTAAPGGATSRSPARSCRAYRCCCAAAPAIEGPWDDGRRDPAERDRRPRACVIRVVGLRLHHARAPRARTRPTARQIVISYSRPTTEFAGDVRLARLTLD